MKAPPAWRHPNLGTRQLKLWDLSPNWRPRLWDLSPNWHQIIKNRHPTILILEFKPCLSKNQVISQWSLFTIAFHPYLFTDVGTRNISRFVEVDARTNKMAVIGKIVRV
jgi:hypothetical protein